MPARRQLPSKKNRRRPRKKTEENFHADPLFGKIPLVPYMFLDAKGQEHTTYSYDLDYKPGLPRGAVRGDVREQYLCLMCHVPRYFYVDAGRSCIQCGRDFLFSAAEQKFWYEELKFYGTSVPVRCQECRRQKRTERSLGTQIGLAKASLKQNRNDPALLLDLAEAIALYQQRTGQGKLNEAIAAARRARRLDPQALDAFFWEACCHAQAGRKPKAKELFKRFLECPPVSKKHQDLAEQARQYLGGNG
jgi:tetratricopeptide (TPR) repeat protein